MHMDLWFNVNHSYHSTQSIHITVLLCTFSVHISARFWVAIVHTEKKSGTTRDRVNIDELFPVCLRGKTKAVKAVVPR